MWMSDDVKTFTGQNTGFLSLNPQSEHLEAISSQVTERNPPLTENLDFQNYCVVIDIYSGISIHWGGSGLLPGGLAEGLVKEKHHDHSEAKPVFWPVNLLWHSPDSLNNLTHFLKGPYNVSS